MNGQANDRFLLADGSRVAVVGGGPAGSFFSHFLLLLAERVDKQITVDIYEPRDFWVPGPAGCNMCGGIISESLVQSLAVEGISLPDTVVQRGIEAYVMHTETGACRLDTPVGEKRIAAVHRGGGPRTAKEGKWESFDAHLLKLAIAQGANFYCSRVTDIRWNDGRPELETKGQPPQTYDLVAGAVGINSPDLKLFENLGLRYTRPRSTKTFITELPFDPEWIQQSFGNAMHVFLLNIPRLQFAALIPKGDYLTMCLLGESIDSELVRRFFEHSAVRQCFPPGWKLPADICRCSPKMFFGNADHAFGDRVVMVGDSGVSRLYKDGIGAAYRTAKAAARTAVFQGVSAEAFRKHYWPECQHISRDNQFGRAIFAVVHLIKELGFPSEAMLRIARAEQSRPGRDRRLSMVLWDTFTGNAPYRDIFFRSLHPALLASLAWQNAIAAAGSLGGKLRGARTVNGNSNQSN